MFYRAIKGPPISPGMGWTMVGWTDGWMDHAAPLLGVQGWAKERSLGLESATRFGCDYANR